jgi:hypothetical protein
MRMLICCSERLVRWLAIQSFPKYCPECSLGSLGYDRTEEK